MQQIAEHLPATEQEQGASTNQQHGQRRVGPGIFVAAAAGVVMGLLFLLMHNCLCDDAYITLDYAKNLALHLHWGLNPQQTANTATSPLNVLLLGLVTAATRISGDVHPVLALGIVSVGLAMVLGWSLTRVTTTLRLPLWTAPLATAVVLFNPYLLSAVGLEVLPVAAALALLLATAVERRPVWFGVVAGLALVTRVDLVIFVLLIAACTKTIRHKWLPALVTMICVAAPWYLFSWVVLGSAVPATLAIKLSQAGQFGVWSFVSGPVMVFTSRPIVVMLAFAPAVMGVLALVSWLVVRCSVRSSLPEPLARLAPVAGLGFGGVAYYIAYSLLDVPPYHWYYVSPMTSLAIFLVISVAGWLTAMRKNASLRPIVPAIVMVMTALLGLGNLAVDLKQGVPWKSPVIFGNAASAQDYARIGADLPALIGNAPVASSGEIGTVAYFCGCKIVDEFSDPGEDAQLINEGVAKAGPITKVLDKINYFWLDHKQQPQQAQYVLRYYLGPGSGPDVWQVWSAANGIGHITLTPTH